MIVLYYEVAALFFIFWYELKTAMPWYFYWEFSDIMYLHEEEITIHYINIELFWGAQFLCELSLIQLK